MLFDKAISVEVRGGFYKTACLDRGEKGIHKKKLRNLGDKTNEGK